MDYRDANRAYWEKGYNAPNVDHHMVRFYEQILRVDFPELTRDGGRLVDFGCGQGAAVDYLVRRGFNARGCDISQVNISVAQTRYPDLANRFEVVDPDPAKVEHYGFDRGVEVVTAFQSLYYFNDEDLGLALEKIHASMKPGGVFFATMIGTQAREFYDNSEPGEGGLRQVQNYYMLFTDGEGELKRRFSMFEPVHVGYDAERLRVDEGDGFHYTFCGRKG